MRSMLLALGGLLAGLLIGGAVRREEVVVKKQVQKTEPKNPFTKYKFNCWLCSGETQFDAVAHVSESKTYDHPCKWCGMDNRVEIKPTYNVSK